MLLAAAEDPAMPSSFLEHLTIRWAFRITPTVPQRTLRRAFDKLVRRHDSLRLKFVKQADEWQAEVLPDHPTGLMVVDLTHLSRAAQDAAILERAIQPISAVSNPLFEMILFKCGKVGDVVLTRANHAIIDGYSIVILIEDLLKIVLNAPLQGTPPGHAEYLGRRQDLLRERPEEKEAFWQEQLLPLPDDLNIGRKAKGLEPFSPLNLGKTNKLVDILTPEQSTKLEEKAKAAGVSVFSCLHAAFSETICLLGGQSEVIITSILGRQDTQMTGFVGAEMQGLWVKYVSKPSDITERAAWVADKIAQATDYLPTSAMFSDRIIPNAFTQKNTTRSRFLVHTPQPGGWLTLLSKKYSPRACRENSRSALSRLSGLIYPGRQRWIMSWGF
jgi:hypothetical protein